MSLYRSTEVSWTNWLSLAPGLAVALVWLVIAAYDYARSGRQPLSLTVPPLPSSGVKLYYPVGAVDYREAQGLTGNLLVSLNWGEYVFWRLPPRVLVAPDGRYDTA